MPTYRVFIGGMPTGKARRSLERARADLDAARRDNPDAHVVLRERRRFARGATGWSNVDNWIAGAIQVEPTE